MADYSELFKEELKYHAELEKSIDEKYITIIQLEVEILELKKQIDRTVKKGGVTSE